MEHWSRDKRIWRFFCTLLRGWLLRKFNYTPEPVEAEGPYLVLANHVTDWDPLLLGIAFGPERQMYFVASEHIFRWGFMYRLINWLLHPIARLKGTTASDTVMTVMRRIKKGASVAIFAEGDRTWDGRTGSILPATGKLARSCGATLVTYRLEGGYLTSPRWAGGSLRRGRMRGVLAGVYPHGQLAAMTPEQVSRLIDRDLFEDACARQRADPVAYRGKNPAQGLETMLFMCPRCGAAGAMTSAGDKLRCGACGLEAVFDCYGFLRGSGLPFEDIPSWDAWQTGRLEALISASAPDRELFHDGNVSLDVLDENRGVHGQTRLGTGTLDMTGERIACAGHAFPLEEISGMGLHGPLCLSFTSAGAHYELRGERPACIRKYMTAFGLIRDTAVTKKEVTHQ